MNKKLRFNGFAALWAAAILLASQWAAHAQQLQHRYSFFNQSPADTTAIDTVGANTGTFQGTAAISNGLLVLDGSGYVQLQPGIVTNDLAVTIEAWCDLPPVGSQNNWANLIDFGTKDAGGADSYSISFCVNTANPAENLDIALSDTDNANATRDNCYAPETLIADTNETHYLVGVVDPAGKTISIWVDGNLINSVATAQTVTPGVHDLNNWIGADNWGDPLMIGNVHELRVWNGVLSGLQIAASYQYGFTNINTNAGTATSVQVSAGPQVVQGGQENVSVVADASLITNTVNVTAQSTFRSANTNIATVDATGAIHGIGIGSTTIFGIFEGQSNSVSVTVVEPVSVLVNRYSFNDSGTNVIDSVSGRDGFLGGTATESGGQVILDGSTGCYVDLSANAAGEKGLISGYQSATIDYWATFSDLKNWNYAWALGNTVNAAGQNYIHSVVRDGDTRHEIDNFTSAGGAGTAALGDFADETVHCTTVIDVPTGHLAIYTNGILSGYTTTDFAPLSSIATNLAYIGRSLWTGLGPTGTGDPYVAGSFDEFRVYNGTLTPQQIALADILGPNNTNLTVGALQSISVSIPTLNLNNKYLGGALATYANLTNFDVVKNSTSPQLVYTSSASNVVFQASDGMLHAVGVGTATITANYGGFTASQVVTVQNPAPILVDRYSFQDAVGSTNAIDSVAGAAGEGVLPNGGTYTGTNLQLSAAGPLGYEYVQLPPKILKTNYLAVTIDIWYTSPDQIPVNSMLWAFGNTDTNSGNGYNYLFCAPQGGRIALSGVDPGYNDEQGTGGAGDLSNQSGHLTAVFDPPSGVEKWYTNGVLCSENTNITTPLLYVEASDDTNYICRSLYTGDPHEDLYLTEFRIYNGALSDAQVAQSQALGPSVTLPTSGGGSSGPTITAAVSGTSLVLSWPTSATGYALYSSPSVGPGATWTQVGASPTTVGSNFQVTVPIGASGSQFYILKN